MAEHEQRRGNRNDKNSNDRGKKRKWENAKQQFGGRHKNKDLGRGAWSRQRLDKRSQNEESAAKRQKIEQDGDQQKPSVLPKPFSQEEIDAEERRPKHKVAVMIGYSGSGYRGMQINTTERTIEGDLFTAFVEAGAISKANANDPKKSGLVRCARTDKGVHAAGNVVSLKLIVEDEDIVQRINERLSPQIRVWGIQRTVNSFSCYQACDSRWYEYLIPTHSFLPPHPSSFLGKMLVELAEEAGDGEGFHKRQKEVEDFWTETEEKYIKPILDELDEHTRELVQKALYETGTAETELVDAEPNAETGTSEHGAQAEEQSAQDEEPSLVNETKPISVTGDATTDISPETTKSSEGSKRTNSLDVAIKRVRAAYMSAKRAYRISPARLERIQPVLSEYLGTQSFHNYTIQKSATDPSAKRVIKSFTVDTSPKLIRDTEWLSIKIHGQSFMMHQIRKMISAAVLVVRNGCPISIIKDTLSQDALVSIPKVPGLGLLLERPVFASYNTGAAQKFQREEIDFAKYDKEIVEFKQREIYERIFREEEEGNAFYTFFGHLDGFKAGVFLWASCLGVEATKKNFAVDAAGQSATSDQARSTDGNASAAAARSSQNQSKEVDSEDESDAEEGRLRPDTDG